MERDPVGGHRSEILATGAVGGGEHDSRRDQGAGAPEKADPVGVVADDDRHIGVAVTVGLPAHDGVRGRGQRRQRGDARPERDEYPNLEPLPTDHHELPPRPSTLPDATLPRRTRARSADLNVRNVPTYRGDGQVAVLQVSFPWRSAPTITGSHGGICEVASMESVSSGGV